MSRRCWRTPPKSGAVPGLRIVGTAAHKAAVVSFVMEGLSTLDIGVKLDRGGDLRSDGASLLPAGDGSV